MDNFQASLISLGVFTIFCVILWYMWSFLYQQYWWKWVRIYNHSDGRFTIFKYGGSSTEIDTYSQEPNLEACRKQSKDIIDILYKQKLDFTAIFNITDSVATYTVCPDVTTSQVKVWRNEERPNQYLMGYGYLLTIEGEEKILKYLRYLYTASHGIIIVNRSNIAHASRATTVGVNTPSTKDVKEASPKSAAEEVHSKQVYSKDQSAGSDKETL